MNPEPDPWEKRLGPALDRLAQDASADVDVEAALRKVKQRFNEPEVLTFPVKRSNRTFLRAAVAALALVGGSLIWKSVQDRPAGPTQPQAQTYETGIGETEAVTLPDGSRAVLGPASHLAVATGYGSDQRVVELDGEALFDVRHDDSQPFSVRTATATIRDLGTVFTVRSVTGSDVRVAVTAGSVILYASNSVEEKGVLLRAGDLGVLNARGHATLHTGSINAADTAFVNGSLVFREAGMKDVATELKRWYGIHLVVDASVAARHITADFNGETREQVVNVIALALGVQIKLEGDTARITAN